MTDLNQLTKSQYKILIDIVDEICYNRPIPNREYDQIYMKAYSMIKQAFTTSKFISGKEVVFLGDGDGMSQLFAALADEHFIDPPKSITVLDFDERIIRNTARSLKLTSFHNSSNCVLYNVVNPLDINLKHKFDTFYINPPYGSKNEGFSCILWLHRCVDLCKKICNGLIVIPNDSKISWTKFNALKILNFLNLKGFSSKIINIEHEYFLYDNPQLKSITISVETGNLKYSEFENEVFTWEQVKNLYGREREVPKYIRVDENDLKGRKEF